ncbi:hypothetical protein VP03_32350 [Sinorhizobium meliloti]|nr:hypothetical protein VP03_32350 [Sinorhizobium meliloti]
MELRRLNGLSLSLTISQATYFNWKKKYAGLLPSEMRKLKQLEDENARLKKIVACKFRGNPPPDSEMISPPNSEK